MQVTIETIIPLFAGFYNTIFEDYWNNKEEVGKIFTDNINTTIKEVLPSFNYTFERIQSPKYYNYGTDELYASATFDFDELLNYLIQNNDKFEEYCKNNFSSYDGFWSYLPNNAYEFVEKFKKADEKDASSYVFGSISFVLENSFGENIKDELNEETYWDVADNLPTDEEDDEENEDTYDDDYVAERMERNPNGYYNSEKDYGTDADEKTVDEGYDDKFDRLSSLYEKPKFYVADENDEFVQGGFESEEEAQNWIYKYCNDNAITPEDFVIYQETEKEDGSKLYSDDKLQRLTDLNEAKDDTGNFTVVIYGQNMDTMVLTGLDKNEPIWDNADDKNVEPLYLTVDEAERIADEEQKTADKGIANKYYGKSFGSQTMSRAEFNLNFRNEQIEESFDYKQQDKKFQFQLLDRMKQDCEYFLGNGNRQEKFLWAGNVDDQIKAMRDLQSRLNPEWLSKEDIDRYESQMKDDENLNESSKSKSWEVDGFTYDTEEEARNAFKMECECNPAEDHVLMCNDEEIDYFEADSEYEDENLNESLNNDNKIFTVELVRKPKDLKEMTECINIGRCHIVPAKVQETVTLSKQEYKDFCSDFLRDREWLAGKGGSDEKSVFVVAVQTDNERTLYVDPEGYKYARYVGYAKINLDTLMNENKDQKVIRQVDGSYKLQKKLPNGEVDSIDLYDTDKEVESDADKPSKKFIKQLNKHIKKHGKLKGDGTDKLDENKDPSVDKTQYVVVYQGDGCYAVQRRLKNGQIDRDSLYDPDEKAEAEARAEELNKMLAESTVFDHSWYEVKGGKYPKRTKEGVIIKETKSNHEMIKAIMENWAKYTDDEKSALKSAIFKAGLGESAQLRKLYKKIK